ncbi:MAG: sulfurtransferase [Myxococcales bacterium]|nr:sulfurtransferase [Myxococcales bacterium]
MSSFPTPILSPEQLASWIRSGDAPFVFDARIGPDARDSYLTSHIQGAIFADVNLDLAGDLSRPEELGRHPLPPLDSFLGWLASLGISKTTRVVAYDDQSGANAAARLWWMLRATGHTQVAIVDGGIQAAIAASVPMESGMPERKPVAVAADNNPALSTWSLPTVDITEVDRYRADPNWKLIDVRSAPRYRGEMEPIDPLAGHIPGAISVPYTENLDEHGRFLPKDTLRKLYAQILQNTRPDHVIVQCGSGVTACHTLVALELAGLNGAKLFVGSFGQWCRTGRPIATGITGSAEIDE